MSYPEFAFRPLTRTSYLVVDAQTGEEYGTVSTGEHTGLWYHSLQSGHLPQWLTRTEAAEALYRSRYAHGFEAGAL